MGYDFTLLLTMPGITKETATAYRKGIERAKKKTIDEKKTKWREATEEKKRIYRNIRNLKVLDQDQFAVGASVTKKFVWVDRDSEGTATTDDSSGADTTDEPEYEFEIETPAQKEKHDREIGRQALYSDNTCDVLPEEMNNNFVRLSQKDKSARLMIFAHGSKMTGKVAGLTSAEMADKLAARGLESGATRLRISIIACYAGATLTIDGKEVNFARDLHRTLKERHGVVSEVSARTAEMKAMRIEFPDNPLLGYGKFVKMADDPASKELIWKRKEPGSKFIWTFDEEGKQQAIDRYGDRPGQVAEPKASWEAGGGAPAGSEEAKSPVSARPDET